ncbi:MAG: ABC transporter permease subunit [Lachnospiraceae bacterium]|nr:ABC transporter permease subunit [Lachnospiraceae bacterium]
MYHILKAEIGKLFRSRTFLICSIIAALMSVILLASYKMMSEVYTPEFIENLNQQTATQSGVSFQASEELDLSFFQNLSGISMLEMSFAGDVIQTLLAVLVSIFVCTEFSGGAIKNIASRGFSRTKIYTAKYIVCVIGGIILSIVVLLTTFLGGTLLWGVGETGGDFIGNLLTFLGVQFFLIAALTGLMVFVSMVVRNTGGSIAINVCVIMFASMIFQLFDLLIDSETFRVADYWIGNIVAQITSLSIPSELLERGIIVGVVTLLVTYIAGAAQFKLGDIK